METIDVGFPVWAAEAVGVAEVNLIGQLLGTPVLQSAVKSLLVKKDD
jgi:hypothetical protein